MCVESLDHPPAGSMAPRDGLGRTGPWGFEIAERIRRLRCLGVRICFQLRIVLTLPPPGTGRQGECDGLDAVEVCPVPGRLARSTCLIAHDRDIRR
jgi:hypothetical protein